MIDKDKRDSRKTAKDKVRERMKGRLDPDNYEYFPASITKTNYYDNETVQHVGIYVRVSTDDIRQTTSYELQKKYYEDFVTKHPNWQLVEIYADEGISGTSLAHRDSFNRMIADAKAGRITLIICKSVSRFARNITDCIGMLRMLADLRNPVGVFFESECLFSLDEDIQVTLTFMATMAEEESHTRSRSMETSLRMRLDNGIPLTPKLLGYMHDSEGNLIINPEEAPTVKLVFYMFLFGYSTTQIARALNALGRRSYLGNINWSANGIVQILRNERHCGDVRTRKTFTPNYRDHKSRKNRGERPQSMYYNHHEAIVSRDDFIAVQRMLDNARYGHKHYLPELRVIDSGFLRGYVTIHPKWMGFSDTDFFQASASVLREDEMQKKDEDGIRIKAEPGKFDYRGFEIVRTELLNDMGKCSLLVTPTELKFNTKCVREIQESAVEILIHPWKRHLAVRQTETENRSRIKWSKQYAGQIYPRVISTTAFGRTLYKLMGWDMNKQYHITGTFIEKERERLLLFQAENARVIMNLDVAQDSGDESDSEERMPTTRRVKAIPERWTDGFGEEFYHHERAFAEISEQTEESWQIMVKGRLYETDKPLHVTDYDTLRTYIQNALGDIDLEGA